MIKLFVICFLLFFVGIPLCLWISDHIKELWHRFLHPKWED